MIRCENGDGIHRQQIMNHNNSNAISNVDIGLIPLTVRNAWNSTLPSHSSHLSPMPLKFPCLPGVGEERERDP